MLHRRFYGVCCLCMLVWFVPVRAGDEVPAWLQQAVATKVSTYDKDVPAVVLHDEQNVTVSDDGKVVTVHNYAIRILLREARGYAYGRVHYLKDTEKVREMKGWLIRPTGEPKRYGKDQIADLAADPNDVYDESRVKMVDASDDAEVGQVFGFTSTTESRSIFSQDIWQFQSRLPVLLSRYTLSLPNGWRATTVTFNRDKIEPTISGATYFWELRDLPPIKPEVASPEVSNLVPRMAVSYFPPNDKSAGWLKTFADWTEVSRWHTAQNDARCDVNDDLAGKARELVVNAKTEYEKIQILGRYAQKVQYISVQIGVGRGGGYMPHAATEIFAKNYGDCKDKANLMRAMLRAVNINAYPVAIFSGDPTYVREEWASPQQFNHAIIAVKVSDATQAPTIIENANLGRLLIFDPTDPHVPVGDLPDYLQNSFALIIAGDKGGLMRMPVTPPEANKLERVAEVTLTAEGSISGSLQENSKGQAAVTERRALRRNTRSEYETAIERWLNRGMTGAKIAKLEVADQEDEGRFNLTVQFSAAQYGQVMQGRLLVFKPALVSRLEHLNFTEGERKAPIVLEPYSFSEKVTIKLPAGFEVDETPDSVKLETSFGSYSSGYKTENGQLLYTRSMLLKNATIPTDKYSSVRDFFARIRAAELNPVVLVHK